MHVDPVARDTCHRFGILVRNPVAAALLISCFGLAGLTAAQDSKFPTDIYGHNVVHSSTQSLSHSVSDMIENVRDVYGDSVADQMATDLGSGGTIAVVELFSPPGRSRSPRQ